MTLATATNDCVAAVCATFGSVFAVIDEWRVSIETLIDASAGILDSAQVDTEIEALVVPELSSDGALVIGAGFVAAPRFLADTDWHLAWWLGHSNTFGLGSADPSIRRLMAVEDEFSESFRDYTNLEWWRVPARTGTRHVTGPYVDYLCTDDYTLTLTVPVTHGSTMVGVVGADLYVNDIERILLPRVRAIAGTATIVNASGRVVVSTDVHRATGSLLRSPKDGAVPKDGADGAMVPCGDTGLSLAPTGRVSTSSTTGGGSTTEDTATAQYS